MDSGFRIPDSGSGFRIPVSGFRVLGLPNTVNSNKRIGIFSAEIFIIQVVYFVEILLIQTQVVNSNHFALKASNCLRSASWMPGNSFFELFLSDLDEKITFAGYKRHTKGNSETSLSCPKIYLSRMLLCATKQQFCFPLIHGVLHLILDLPGELTAKWHWKDQVHFCLQTLSSVQDHTVAQHHWIHNDVLRISEIFRSAG